MAMDIQMQKLASLKDIHSREEIAQAVSKSFASGKLNHKEIDIAVDILRLLLKDAEKTIRQTIANSLHSAIYAPRDIILKLANDEYDIASKVLENSLVLTDDDLQAIIKSTKEALSLCSIARRKNLSERIASDLVQTKDAKVVSNLFANHSAKLSSDIIEKGLPIVLGSVNSIELLVQHGNLPPLIAEKIFSAVSGEIKQNLMQKYKMNNKQITEQIYNAQDWNLLGAMPVSGISHPNDDAHIDELISHLEKTGRLSHSLAVRALCAGCLNLFEATIARLANVPRANARILLMGGANGFHALYKAAQMPETFAESVHKLWDIAIDVGDYNQKNSSEFRKQVIENIYVLGYHRSVDGMAYLLRILDERIIHSTSVEKEAA